MTWNWQFGCLGLLFCLCEFHLSKKKKHLGLGMHCVKFLYISYLSVSEGHQRREIFCSICMHIGACIWCSYTEVRKLMFSEPMTANFLITCLILKLCSMSYFTADDTEGIVEGHGLIISWNEHRRREYN